MKQKTKATHIETLGFILILINIILILYFIFKLEQIESLTQTTQAQSQAIIQTLNQSKTQ